MQYGSTSSISLSTNSLDLGTISTNETTAPALPNPAMANHVDRQNIANSRSWQVRNPTGKVKASDPNASVDREEDYGFITVDIARFSLNVLCNWRLKF